MKHFVVDFMEYTLRKIAYDNSIKCARQVGYFTKYAKELSDENESQRDLY